MNWIDFCNTVCLNESGEISDDNIQFLINQLETFFNIKSTFEL